VSDWFEAFTKQVIRFWGTFFGSIGDILDRMAFLPVRIASGVFQLEVYGESLMSAKVRRELTGWAFVLLSLGVFAFNNWYMAFCEVWTTQHWRAFAITFVLVVVFLVVERLLIVSSQDAKTWTARIIRGLQIAIFSVLLAIPFELRVTHDTISAAFDQRETTQLSVIRERAKNEEMSLLRARAATQSSAETQATAQRRTELATQRAQLVAGQRARHNDLQREATSLSQQTSHESMGDTGHHGVGDVARDLNGRTARAQQRLDESDRQARADLEAFDAHAAEEIRARESASTEARAASEAAMDQKCREIDAMSGEQLTARYGGTYTHGRGFLDQVGMLHHLMASDVRVRWTVWGCRIVVLLIELTPILGSIVMSEETKRYLSFRAQVANRQEDALAMARVMGVTDPDVYGRDEKLNKLIVAYQEACRTAELGLERFHAGVRTFVQPGQNGLAPTYEQIVASMHHAYANHRALFQAVETVAEKIENAGYGAPIMPTRLQQEPDPRLVTRGELELNYGWVDPQPELERGLEAARRIPGLRAELFQLLSDAEAELHQLVSAFARRHEIRAAMTRLWRGRFHELLTELETEEALAARIGKLPAWPSHSPDPRPGLGERVCNPSQAVLDSLRYQDPDQLVPQPPVGDNTSLN
jgi:hypothetical protein